MNRRYEAFFSGHVQGVGFRFTTRHIAQQFVVTGFVRNLPDGRVEVIAEGSEEQLNGFFGEIKSRMEDYIGSTEIKTSDPTDEFELFDVRF